MSIDRLRYFAAVVETGNLRHAAEIVGISPPSMSKAISVLEEELGHKLVYHEGRGIGITSKGLEVYRLSSSLLGEYRDFFSRLSEQGSSNERLRMGTFEVFSSHFIAGFLDAEPAYEFLLLEMTPGKIEQGILAGTINLGLTYLPSPDPALEYLEVGSFHMGVYGLKKWDGLPFEEWPFAIPVTELRIHSSEVDSLDMWPRGAPKRKVRYQFELLETALQTARKGLSVLHCPDFVVHLHNRDVLPSLRLQELSPPPGYKSSKPIKVYLVGRKGNVPVELERKLARFMRSLAKQ